MAAMSYPSKNIYQVITGLLCLSLLCVPAVSMAQVKWDGEAGDGQWSTAANWTGNVLPAATDDVLLDNSIVESNYSVALPGGLASVTVKTIAVSPAAGNAIQLSLPASNTAAPAFTATGPGNGITLNNGAVFLNASGATSASVISIADSFRINNGGQYIHNTRSAHAALVTALSKSPGTEKGIFVFDVPGGGYTIASTNRTYGTLVLKGTASGGSQVYATSAANPFTINGDFVIKTGVTINLDITAATVIKGNYLQEGGVCNLASQPNNNTVFVQGDFLQTAGALTETSTGLPAVEFNGNNLQNVRADGIITNSVAWRVNNAAGISLLSNLVLPYDLTLINGIVNNNSFLITLLAGAGMHADSLSNNSFIKGALRKEGLAADTRFLFPVGKGITQRWLELKNASGNYTVEFFKSNPALMAGIPGAGIHHISSIEYWSVQADAAPAPTAAVELSFDNVNSGGVTDMTTLRAAQLVSGVWTDAGNTATTGTAGSSGSVVSNALTVFGIYARYFALASSDAFQNPLPLQLLSFSATTNANLVMLQWTIAGPVPIDFFELQSSADGIHFNSIAMVRAVENQTVYQYAAKENIPGKKYYRLKILLYDGSYGYTKDIALITATNKVETVQVRPSVVSSHADLYMNAAAAGKADIFIISVDGRILNRIQTQVQQGSNWIPLPVQVLPAGIYGLQISGIAKEIISAMFIKTKQQ